jgi:hypothetical protein
VRPRIPVYAQILAFAPKAGVVCQLMGKRWRSHYVRIQYGTPVRTKMVTGWMFLNYKSLGDLRMTCERIYNNRFLVLCEFTFYRDK